MIKEESKTMNMYVTIDLDSLMCKLSNKELYDFMLETFRDRVPDESHISLITEMFKVMFDTDQEDALAAILTSMGENALPTIKEFLNNHPCLNKEKPIEGLTESGYNYLVSHCKHKIERCKDNLSLAIIYNEHRIFLELLERVGRNFIERK